MNQIAEAQIGNGEPAEAAVALHSAIKEYKKKNRAGPGVNNGLCICLNNLGIALSMEDDLPGAAEAYKQAASAYAASPEHGPHHASTAMVMNNLGMLLQQEGKAAEAEGCFRRALGPILPYVTDVGSPESDARAFLKMAAKRTSTLPAFTSLPTRDESAISDLLSAATLLRSNLASCIDDVGEKVRLYRSVLESEDARRGRNSPESCLAAQNLALTLRRRMKGEGEGEALGTRKEMKVLARRLVASYSKLGEKHEKELGMWKRWLAKN